MRILLPTGRVFNENMGRGWIPLVRAHFQLPAGKSHDGPPRMRTDCVAHSDSINRGERKALVVDHDALAFRPTRVTNHSQTTPVYVTTQVSACFTSHAGGSPGRVQRFCC